MFKKKKMYETYYEKTLIVLIGPNGCGKTTYAKKFVGDGFIVSRDDQGKKAHMQEFLGAIKVGISPVIVDGINFNKAQRDRYTIPAKKLGYTIKFVEFDVDLDLCFVRVVERKSHPTIEANNPKLAEKVLRFYQESYEAPRITEFDEYEVIK